MGTTMEDTNIYLLSFADDQFLKAEDHYKTGCMAHQFKDKYKNGSIINVKEVKYLHIRVEVAMLI
jgi:peptide methionine sulfoxide reductase MsrB